MSDEDSGLLKSAEMEQLIAEIRSKVGDGAPVRLDPTENMTLREWLRVGVVLRPDWEAELHGEGGLGQRLQQVAGLHPCKLANLIEVLDGKDLINGGRTKGMRNEHGDLMDAVEANRKALLGHTTSDGRRVVGLNEWRQDRDRERARMDRLFWVALSATVVGLINLVFWAVKMM